MANNETEYEELEVEAPLIITRRSLPGFGLAGGNVEVSVVNVGTADDEPGSRYEFVVDDFANQQRFRGQVLSPLRWDTTESGIREVIEYLVSLSSRQFTGHVVSRKLADLCRKNCDRLHFLLGMLKVDPGSYVTKEVYTRKNHDSSNDLVQPNA